MVTPAGKSMSMVRLAMLNSGKEEGESDGVPLPQLHLIVGGSRKTKMPWLRGFCT